MVANYSLLDLILYILVYTIYWHSARYCRYTILYVENYDEKKIPPEHRGDGSCGISNYNATGEVYLRVNTEVNDLILSEFLATLE